MIAPGRTLPLQIDWSEFLASQLGFDTIQAVKSIEIINQNINPPVPADPTEIALVSGLNPDPVPAPTPGYTQIFNGNLWTQNMVKVGASVPVGSLYRLNVTIISRDCAGRELVMDTCVAINIVLC